jgi:hypothetical protein
MHEIKGVCHLSFWLILDTFEQYGWLYLAPNLLFVLPITFYCTWLFNHSGYSLPLPIVFHLGFNIVNTAPLPVILILGAFDVLILFSWISMIRVFPILTPKNV